MKKLIALILAAALCLSVAGFAFADEAEDSTEITGGWSVNTDIDTTLIDEDSAAIFDKAMEGLVGVEYVPIAVLGTQVVAGTNISYLCKATTVTAEPVVKLAIVTIYVDLDQNASILNITDLDLNKYLGSSEETGEEVTFTLNFTYDGNTDTEEVTTNCATLGELMRNVENVVWEDTEWGFYMTGYGDYVNDDNTATYWMLYVNDEYSMVGADEVALNNGDVITWSYETYSYDAE